MTFEFAKLLATAESESVLEQVRKEVLSFGFGEFGECHVDNRQKASEQEEGSNQKEPMVKLVAGVEVK